MLSLPLVGFCQSKFQFFKSSQVTNQVKIMNYSWSKEEFGQTTHLLTMHLMMSWCLCWASSTFLYFSAEFFPFFLSFVKRLVAHLTVGMMLNGGGNVEPSKYDIHNLVLANFHSLKCQYNHVMDVFWLTSTFSLDEMFYFSFMVWGHKKHILVSSWPFLVLNKFMFVFGLKK